MDLTKFENDPQYGGCAFKTKAILEAWRIGIIGAFMVVIQGGWIKRIKANPMKVLTGVAQLTACAALVFFTASLAISNPLPFAIGCLIS